MTVRVIRSTDVGAPALTGQVGALIGVLDACLVNGLAAMNVSSITRVGNVATVTTSAPHNMVLGSVGHRLTIAGADQADYNVVDAAITVTAADQFTYAVANAPVTPATGTLTAKKNGAGWTKPFSGTNTAVYRQPAGSNQHYLDVSDTNATYTRVRGYEVMTAVATGTGPFPTDTQLSGGGYMTKSASGDATARPWLFVTNGKLFHLIAGTGIATSAWVTAAISTVNGAGLTFGDCVATNDGDAFATVLIAGNNTSYQGGQHANQNSVLGAVSAHFCPRPYTQIGSSIQVGKVGNPALGGGTSGLGAITYPNPQDGGLYFSPYLLCEPNSVRGSIPGLWSVNHNISGLSNGMVFDGQGAFSGRTFEVVAAQNGSSTGAVMLELSDTW